MTKHIEEIVSSCAKCLKYQSKLPKEPMQTREIPLFSWKIISSDVLEQKNQKNLVVIDYYSKYIEAVKLNSKTTNRLCSVIVRVRVVLKRTVVIDSD